MNRTSRYKVFKLPYFFNYYDYYYTKKDFLKQLGEPIEPKFNRYGLYLDRYSKTCWIETKFGCYDYSRNYNQQLYELRLLNHRPLREEEYKALCILSKNKLLYDHNKELYITEIYYRDYKQVITNAKLAMLDVRKKTK